MLFIANDVQCTLSCDQLIDYVNKITLFTILLLKEAYKFVNQLFQKIFNVILLSGVLLEKNCGCLIYFNDANFRV